MSLAKAARSTRRKQANMSKQSAGTTQIGRLGRKANGALSAVARPAHTIGGSSSRGRWAANLNGRQPRRAELLPQKRQKGF